MDWHEGETNVDINGRVDRKYWKLVNQDGSGNDFYPGSDSGKELRPLDFFMAVMPMKQLREMEKNTSASLIATGKAPTSIGEILKWIGVNILATRYEFGDRASLWNRTPTSKYVPAKNFGELTGMSRDRYDALMKHVVWSMQPKERPPHMSHEAWRWMLVDGFVDNINNHRATHYKASDLICVDESIARWYGLGGTWINMGLPMYVAIDRKPEDGCEIQNCCDGRSNVMMRLKLVKSKEEEDANTV